MSVWAIVGSQGYPLPELVRRFVYEQLAEGDEVVSGGAKGPDKIAIEAAKERGLAWREILANWDLYGRSAGMIRNGDIVKACERLTAFWDGKSPGTENSIERARKAGKLHSVFGPDGEPMTFGDGQRGLFD